MNYQKRTATICLLLLAALTLAVYWQTTGFELVNLDDMEYTTQNPVVKGGLTTGGIKEVLTSIQLHTYMPLTLLSYMLDVEIFGLSPFGFHLTNTLLHLFNTLLLFAFLHRATGSPWKSFFAAALWAVHPLRAESVAWVAERKDLLSGFFGFAGLLAYAEYARDRNPLLYTASLLAMLLGLVSKAVLVVFPFLLLILDFWPLERIRPGEVKRLLSEKVPFFALSVFFSAITLSAQTGTIQTFEQRGAVLRLFDVTTSYLHYLGATFWPLGLVPEDRYTAPSLTGLWAVAAMVFLMTLTILAVKARKAAPAVAAGWLWYLFALFPVSGIVPLEFYFVADHFTYLPHVGLIMALVWGAEAVYSRFSGDSRPLIAGGAVLLVVLPVLCFRQVSLWKDDFTLFGYADRVTGGKSPLAKSALGAASFNAGNYREAYERYGEALAIDPENEGVNGYMGSAAAKLGKFREAAFYVRKQLQLTPGDKESSLKLAKILILDGDLPGAARQTLVNIRSWPEEERAREPLEELGGEFGANMIAGEDMAGKRFFAEAEEYFREAVRISPRDYGARLRLALVLREKGDLAGAQREIAEAKKLSPGSEGGL